ncbi:hypothetical protein J2800_003275 [Caulobacter rhizosphaerae]|jgi:hypothetical protein|uniref:Uncharacterized protein n=1 Tax=Caulobacter rhizosphaerae TaxID=2010972 RepID=A0ABU1N281_9CAUL|nr:hypothetical protein [Caulobacter rhizosphaerae]MDR6532517.1 hypothetical protein [Caulobacter rhizosphaerae]
MTRPTTPFAASLLAAALAMTLGLAACGQAPAARTPAPPAQFVDARTLPLSQASAGDYDRVLETGLAAEPQIWRAPNVSTKVYRAPVGLGREAIAAYYRKAAAEGGWVADPSLTPPARALAGQYWSFGYKAGPRRFMVAGVEPGPALAVPPAGLPVVVRTNAD